MRADPTNMDPVFLLHLRWQNLSPLKTTPSISLILFGDDLDLGDTNVDVFILKGHY